MSLADPDDRPCVVHCFRAASVSDFARDAWAMQKGHLMAVALETIILCRLSRSYIIYHVYSQYIGVSLNRSPPKSPMLFQFNRIFHYKSSILVYLHLWKPPYYIVDIAYCLLPFFVVGCMTPQKNQCGAGLPSHVCLIKPLRRPTTVNPGQMGDWSRPIITIFWGINIHSFTSY